MAEFITRKFTDKADGTPRTGLNVRLKSVTDPALDPIVLQEIVTLVEADKGQYYAAAIPGGAPTLVPHGVYTIERDEGLGAGYEPFEGEISVNPLRSTGNKTGKFPLLDRVVADVVRVASFLGDNEVGTMAHIQEAVNYAASRGGYVVVGAYGAGVNGTIWTGSPVTVPDGVTLDLAGATLYANSAPDVSVLNLAGAATIKNGTLRTEYVSGSRVCTQADAGSNVNFENVTFVRAGTAYPTCADSSNDETPTSYFGCQPVTLAVAFGDGGYTRLQRAYGCIPVYEVGGTIPITPIERANVAGIEVAEIVRNIPTALGTAPSLTPPFSNGERFVEAVKQLWFVEQPANEAAIAALQAEIGDVPFIWTGASGPSNLNGDPARLSIGTMDPAGFSISAYGCSVLERKAKSRGAGTSAVIDISVVAAIKISYSGVASGDDLIIGADIDMSDMESAFAAENPGYLSITNDSYYFDASFISGAYDVYGYGLVSSPADSPVWGLRYPQCWMETGKIKFLTLRIEIGSLGIPASGDIYFIAEIKASVPVRLSADHATAGNPAFGTSMGFNPVAR
jgi:hypothetical protein